jgi:hypothetical protein
MPLAFHKARAPAIRRPAVEVWLRNCIFMMTYFISVTIISAKIMIFHIAQAIVRVKKVLQVHKKSITFAV